MEKLLQHSLLPPSNLHYPSPRPSWPFPRPASALMCHTSQAGSEVFTRKNKGHISLQTVFVFSTLCAAGHPVQCGLEALLAPPRVYVVCFLFPLLDLHFPRNPRRPLLPLRPCFSIGATTHKHRQLGVAPPRQLTFCKVLPSLRGRRKNHPDGWPPGPSAWPEGTSLAGFSSYPKGPVKGLAVWNEAHGNQSPHERSRPHTTGAGNTACLIILSL
jgi:hypothetical protein